VDLMAKVDFCTISKPNLKKNQTVLESALSGQQVVIFNN